MIINRLLGIVLIVASASWSSCDNRLIFPYNFQEQDVEGKIQSETWIYLDGLARTSLFSEDTLLLQLFNEDFGNPCSFLISEKGIRFTIPAQEGLYLLSSIPQSYQTVTIYDGANEFLALGGAIEIELIDKDAKIVKGKIDARYDSNNQVNGKFSIRFCD